jgi:hypothetical protein
MKIINDGISKEIYEFLVQDYYDHEAVKGKYSATTLLKPTRQIILMQRHDNEIEVKASSMFFRVLGSAVHGALEKLKVTDVIQEQRFDANIKVKFAGAYVPVIITGKTDVIRILDEEIVDYKTGSVWKWILNDFEDYAEQLSIYRFLLAKQDKPLITGDKGRVVFMMRDWSESAKDRTNNYPPLPIMDVNLDLETVGKCEANIKRKVLEIMESERVADDALPMCTDKERWKHDNRCRRYCSAAPFCSYGKYIVGMK